MARRSTRIVTKTEHEAGNNKGTVFGVKCKPPA